jgi:transposase-like protein
LEEAGDKPFTFTRFPPSQWKSIRTSNAIERLHEEFKRRIKTQTALPCAETAAMSFWALLASGQITMRKVDGWQTLAEKPDGHRQMSISHFRRRIRPSASTIREQKQQTYGPPW